MSQKPEYKPEGAADLTTPEGLDAFVKFAQRAMRDNVEKDGELGAVAFVIARRDPRTGKRLESAVPAIVPLAQAMAEFDDKDEVARTLARFAKACDAYAIIVGLEAWMKNMMGTPMGEVITCSVEVRGEPQGTVYMSYIQRDGGKVSTSEWQSWASSLNGARFMGLLRDNYGKDSCDA